MYNKYNFTYLSEKIFEAKFQENPFNHIYIENFLSEEHFLEIINSSEINSKSYKNDEELIENLINNGFKPIGFPGCITDIEKYIKWHKGNLKTSLHSACEGFGMALRLFNFKSEILKELNLFISSNEFNETIAEKFKINFKECTIDTGIQKYLDGYEISPHPDVRKKATTFMVNINPNQNSEKVNYHTHYLKFKKEYEYVKEFWKGNENIDRVWVPWNWTKSIKQQTKNNSIVLFSPSNDTLHAVKAKYDHLTTQRTQLYGNLWYNSQPAKKTLEWEYLDFSKNLETIEATFTQKLYSKFPSSIKNIVKKIFPNRQNVGKRNI